MGSTRQNYWGENLCGIRGNDEFFHPEVIAVNKFRQAMNGEKESIEISEDGQVLVVNRGNKGAAIVNISDKANPLALPTGLADGEYHDEVYGCLFVVKNGVLYGTLAADRTYIIH